MVNAVLQISRWNRDRFGGKGFQFLLTIAIGGHDNDWTRRSVHVLLGLEIRIDCDGSVERVIRHEAQ